MSAEALRKKITELSGERAFFLTEHNLPHDYLDLQYDCKYCKDTGVLENGERCKCFSEKLKLYI
jgi:DNA replication protein DnaC